MTSTPPPPPPATSAAPPSASCWARLKEGWRQLAMALGALGVLTLLLAGPLHELMRYASGTDLHSHVVLIPVVAGYLLGLRRGSLPREYRTSCGLALVALEVAAVGLALVLDRVPEVGALSVNDHLILVRIRFS